MLAANSQVVAPTGNAHSYISFFVGSLPPPLDHDDVHALFSKWTIITYNQMAGQTYGFIWLEKTSENLEAIVLLVACSYILYG